MTTTATTTTLQDLCVTATPTWARTPFHVDGWTIATDGKAMLLTRAVPHDCATATDGVAAKVRPYLDLLRGPLNGQPIDMAAVRTWAGEYDPWISCQECDGEGDHYCEACRNTVHCQGCEGLGGWGCDVRYGRLRGELLDRNQLAKYLRCWTEPTAVFTTAEVAVVEKQQRVALFAGGDQVLVITLIDEQSAAGEECSVFEEVP